MGCWQGVGPPPGHVHGFPVGEVSVHFVRVQWGIRVCVGQGGASAGDWGATTRVVCHRPQV